MGEEYEKYEGMTEEEARKAANEIDKGVYTITLYYFIAINSLHIKC